MRVGRNGVKETEHYAILLRCRTNRSAVNDRRCMRRERRIIRIYGRWVKGTRLTGTSLWCR